MKKRQRKATTPQALKRKLVSALSMLLISAVLMTGTTYAWLVLSTAPEVSGITTNVGANGALEIALLTSETREDLSKIRTSAFGESLANERVASTNTTWGNLIDLTVADYGLNELVLLPARLQYSARDDGSYTVNSGLLSVPVYGYDGRVADLTDNTVSAIYTNREFSYNVGVQDYGVRAIGTSDSLSVQASALAMAKGNIVSYTKSANSTAAAALSSNGPDLFGIILAYSGNRNTTFGDSDVAVIKAMVSDLKKSVDYIDLALRQGLVAVAASEIGDKNLFGTVQSKIMDTSKNLSVIIAELTELDAASIPGSFNTWVTKAETAENNLNYASTACDGLSGGSYTWDDLKTPLNYVMNMEKVFINEKSFSELDSSMAGDLMANGALLTLPSGSGVFADVADFAGDYTTAFNYGGVAVEIETLTAEGDNPYLTVLSDSIKDLEAADGSGSGVQTAELTSTYGYALDMAFRCNAAGTSNLLLQTAAVQRIYSDSTSNSTMGGGSYMEFSTKDESLSLDQMLKLMDAVRVAFVDDQGALLNVAKLNISNRSVTDGVVKAPLYIYDFSFSEEDGSMIMGERQKTENQITTLDQNVAKALTVVVWLDGDLVDNSMVSATEEASLSGVLNLQFATDADLIPAGNTALKEATTDKTALEALVTANEAIYEDGQGTYTTTSWNAFVDAYNYAATINESMDATGTQVYIATGKLAEAAALLEQVSLDALTGKIDEIRNLMGLTTDVAAYVLHDKEQGTYITVDTYTEEQKDNALGTVYRVDYDKNLNDEGGNVFTPIYTDESWSALAAALYDAEALKIYDEELNAATDAQIDAIITALETARKNLQHCLFYTPYEFEEQIYYYAVPRVGEAEEDANDTYGRWYDDQFQRITSDLTILNLDARAYAAEVASILESSYIRSSTATISPYVRIYDEAYPALREEDILAVQWSIPENLFVRAITSNQIALLNTLKAQAEALNNDADAAKQVDAALITEVETAVAATGADTLTAEAADALITRLEAAIAAATPEEEPEEEPSTEPAPMTADQRTVLIAAVNAAKAVEGYEESADAATAADGAEAGEAEDPNAAKLEALRTATADVEALLALETGATAENADTKLAALNAALTALGEKEVTAYNTLQYTIPVGSELKEIAYGVEMPYVKLKTTGALGSGKISAVILTKSGIVFTAELDVEIYEPAEGVGIEEPAEIPVGGSKIDVGSGSEENPVLVWDKKVQAAESFELYAELYSRMTEDLDENGQPKKDGKGNTLYVEVPHSETIAEYTWASSDTEVLTVSNEKSATCTVNAVAEGTASVTLSVTTVQGNTYTNTISFTVTAAPEAEEGT